MNRTPGSPARESSVRQRAGPPSQREAACRASKPARGSVPGLQASARQRAGPPSQREAACRASNAATTVAGGGTKLHWRAWLVHMITLVAQELCRLIDRMRCHILLDDPHLQQRIGHGPSPGPGNACYAPTASGGSEVAAAEQATDVVAAFAEDAGRLFAAEPALLDFDEGRERLEEGREQPSRPCSFWKSSHAPHSCCLMR